ncbi:hypothetical protein PCASD_02985 [Puccinia coronata f. sp. avenae]|uniref:Uncharacterized protein n=1 Tax=Puccinia coronata f. sp. avenae TaxID=200324 RepID=A0A2N5VGL7_9BASI|nr:hypothetical protein PCASD_02985 [Puccinia coronata f. sp. avenae]
MISGLALSFLFAAGSCAAGVVPTAPGPGQIFQEGGNCTLSWNLDTTNKWTSFTVDLMSGSNTAMQPVTNVFKDRDGTKGDTSYSWKCPNVTPNSAIYFYQFTQAGADTTWTTRFTIASSSGETTPPANSVQPGGAAIPWGVGRLEGAEAATNTPTTTPSTSANITALNTPTANATASTNVTAGTAATTNTTNTTGITSTTPTQSTSSTGSTSKTSPSSSSSGSTYTTGSSNTSTPTSDASALPLYKNAASALLLAVVVVIAC